MHVAQFTNVVIGGGDVHFFRAQNGRRFFPRPGKVVAVVIERFIGILGRIEPATLAVAQNSIHPMDDFERHPRVFGLDEALEAVHIILQQF